MLESYEDIYKKMYSFALDGREYYLTQYYDYKYEELYKKYRLIVIDGDVHVRHCIFSDHWMIHSGSRVFMDKNPSYQKKEKEILDTFELTIKPKIKETIDEIYKIIKLDYFGIDCSIDNNGEICLFELNANMNVLINDRPDMAKYVAKINNAIKKMIQMRIIK